MKKLQLILNMLLATMTAIVFTACTDDTDKPATVDNTVTPENYTEPTTDQMEVRIEADLTAAVLGQFDENSTGAALVRRLPNAPVDIDFNTSLVLLKGSDFEGAFPLTDEQLYAVAVIYMSGGYIAIERPTERQLDNFYGELYDAIIDVQEDLIEENFYMDEEEAQAAARSTGQTERLQVRRANVHRFARRAGVDTESEVLAEMLILGPIDYFYQEPFEAEANIITQGQDGEGPLTAPVTEIVTIERNGYHSGLMADAAAQWLNDAERRLAETYDEMPDEVRAQTRASANDAINNLMSASETFTFNGRMVYRNYENQNRWTYRIQQTIRSWGVHNFSSNKDYYYVQQNVSLNMGSKDGDYFFYDYPGESYWTPTSNFGYWNCYYGSFLSSYTTSMELVGNGDILMEAAVPTTDNGSTSISVNIGQSSSFTETTGVTWSGTFGITGGKSTATGTVGGSYSTGTTNASSFSLNTSRTYKDLIPVQNRENNKVTWTYKGNLPKYRIEDRDGKYWFMHGTAPEILVNTASLTNEICWSVGNPEGRYTLNVTSCPETAILLYHDGDKYEDSSKEGHYEFTKSDLDNNFRYELTQPNRALQTWNMGVTIDEYVNPDLFGHRDLIVQALQSQFPQLYREQFTLADKTAENLEAANVFIGQSKSVFGQNYDILQNIARDHGAKSFTIHWRRQGATARDSYTVMLDDDNNNRLEYDGGIDDGTNTAANLFDFNFSSKWRCGLDKKMSGGYRFFWVEFHASKAVSPKSYTMVTASDAAQNYQDNPRLWYLYGKKQKTDEWTLLATVDDTYNNGDGLPWANNAVKTKKFDVQPVNMQYFRLEANSWTWHIQLAELYFNY